MPICGARTTSFCCGGTRTSIATSTASTTNNQHVVGSSSFSSWLSGGQPSENWFKRSIAIYLIAMIPYLLQSLSLSKIWHISSKFAYALEVSGAVSFLINSLYDLYVAILLLGGGGFTFIDNKSAAIIIEHQKQRKQKQKKEEMSTSLSTTTTILCNNNNTLLINTLNSINWFLIGSILYVIASVLYLAAPVHYYYAGGSWEPTRIMYIVAASIFVLHASICILATIIGNYKADSQQQAEQQQAEQAQAAEEEKANKEATTTTTTTTSNNKKYILQIWKCRSWKDFDWFLFADISFIASAIWDVLMITDTREMDIIFDDDGSFLSSIGWICNACFYMIAAYSSSISISIDNENNDNDDNDDENNDNDNIGGYGESTTELVGGRQLQDDDNNNNYGSVVSVVSASY